MKVVIIAVALLLGTVYSRTIAQHVNNKQVEYPWEDPSLEKTLLYTGKQIPGSLVIFNVSSHYLQECQGKNRHRSRSRSRGRSRTICSPVKYNMRSTIPDRVTAIGQVKQCAYNSCNYNNSCRHGTSEISSYIDLNRTNSFMAVWSFFIPSESCFKLCIRSSIPVRDKVYLKTDGWIDHFSSSTNKNTWSGYDRVAMNNSYISMIYVYNPLMRKVNEIPYLQFAITQAPTSCSCYHKPPQVQNECKYIFGA